LDDFSKIGHCEINFCNAYVKLHGISTEVEITLKQDIIELVRLSAAESVRDVSFSFP